MSEFSKSMNPDLSRWYLDTQAFIPSSLGISEPQLGILEAKEWMVEEG